MTFAHKFVALRIRCDLTQAEAARVLDVSKRTVEYWESGKRVPLRVMQLGVFAVLAEYQMKGDSR